MTKFNKSLLAAAVAAAVALPGIASAASLTYPAGKQITFAKDLIVNNGTTINTPSELTLRATAEDATRIGTVLSDNVTVKVTLTGGARFDETADANTFVQGFLVGTQLGGTGAPIGAAALVGTPYYSVGGQELNFTFKAPGTGNVGVAPAFALQLNSMQVTNLVQGLYTGNSISAEITAQNNAGQQILASRQEIARSVWGLDISSDLTQVSATSRIDVAAGTGSPAFARKTRFSPSGAVGGAAAAAPNNVLWSAGAIVVDIAKATPIGGGTATYINNFNAVATNPQYNVVGTAEFAIDVKGSNLNAFRANNAFLSSSNLCVGGTSANGTVNAAGDNISWTLPASSPLLQSVTAADLNLGPSTLHVCLRANGQNEMFAQDLSATVSVNYDLPTQRVNPPAVTVDLAPLQINGTTLIYQNVNPGANSRAQSFLRVTNNNADVCPITIDAKDDEGRLSGEVKFTLPAHASLHLNSDELENGSSKATGSFGDGTGRWYVRVTAECNNVKASALNRNSDTGVVTNLTPEKWTGNEWLTPSTRL